MHCTLADKKKQVICNHRQKKKCEKEKKRKNKTKQGNDRLRNYMAC